MYQGWGSLARVSDTCTRGGVVIRSLELDLFGLSNTCMYYHISFAVTNHQYCNKELNR